MTTCLETGLMIDEAAHIEGPGAPLIVDAYALDQMTALVKDTGLMVLKGNINVVLTDVKLGKEIDPADTTTKQIGGEMASYMQQRRRNPAHFLLEGAMRPV